MPEHKIEAPFDDLGSQNELLDDEFLDQKPLHCFKRPKELKVRLDDKQVLVVINRVWRFFLDKQGQKWAQHSRVG